MKFIQAIVQIIDLTNIRYINDDIIPTIHYINESNHFTDTQIIKMISKCINQNIGFLPFLPDDNGWVIKLDKDGEYHVIKTPDSDVRYSSGDKIIGIYGEVNSFQKVSREQITVFYLLKSESKKYYSSDGIVRENGKSLFFTDIFDKYIPHVPKQITVTFFNCANLMVANLNLPIAGLKLVKCKNITVNIHLSQEMIRSTVETGVVIEYYLGIFHCSNVQIIHSPNIFIQLIKEIVNSNGIDGF